jgi:hypothetical protein
MENKKKAAALETKIDASKDILTRNKGSITFDYGVVKMDMPGLSKR